jgi:hypothetical protein
MLSIRPSLAPFFGTAAFLTIRKLLTDCMETSILRKQRLLRFHPRLFLSNITRL